MGRKRTSPSMRRNECTTLRCPCATSCAYVVGLRASPLPYVAGRLLGRMRCTRLPISCAIRRPRGLDLTDADCSTHLSPRLMARRRAPAINCPVCHLTLQTDHDCPGPVQCRLEGCPSYGTVYKTRRSLATHVRVYHRRRRPERYGCGKCGWTGKTNDALLDHVANVHSDTPAKRMCTGCGSVFTASAAANRHVCSDPRPSTARGTPGLVLRISPWVRPAAHVPGCGGHDAGDTETLDADVLANVGSDVVATLISTECGRVCCAGEEGRVLGVPLASAAAAVEAKVDTLTKRAATLDIELPRMGGRGRPAFVPLDVLPILLRPNDAQVEAFLNEVADVAAAKCRSLADRARLTVLRTHLDNAND